MPLAVEMSVKFVEIIVHSAHGVKGEDVKRRAEKDR